MDSMTFRVRTPSRDFDCASVSVGDVRDLIRINRLPLYELSAYCQDESLATVTVSPMDTRGILQGIVPFRLGSLPLDFTLNSGRSSGKARHF